MPSPGLSLISAARLLSITDKMGETWRQIKGVLDVSSAAAPGVGSSRYPLYQALGELAVNSDDYFQQNDLSSYVYSAYTNLLATSLAQGTLAGMCGSVDSHISTYGSLVDASIIGVDTFQAWYNGGSGGAKFSSLLSPDFADLYYYAKSTTLAAGGVMSPAIHPTIDATAVNGMGTKTTGGSYTAGNAVDTTRYSEVAPVVEVIANFSGGSAAPAVTIAGTDDTGSTSTTWSVTLDSNNPAAALSTTISPAVTAMGRQTLAFGSASGIAIGSVLKVNAGLIDEETIIVENVAGANVTAVFRKAHTAGAAITGNRSYATTPSVSGRRIRSVSGITLTLSSHAAGTVRVVGRQDRGNKPD